MEPNHWQSKPNFRRLILPCVGFSLLTLGALTLILSNLDIITIKGSWSSTLVIIFAVVGTICTFGQWVLPLPSSKSRTSMANARREYYEAFRLQLEKRLNDNSKKRTLVIYAPDYLLDKEVNLTNAHNPNERCTSRINKRIINGHIINVAIFQNLEYSWCVAQVSYMPNCNEYVYLQSEGVTKLDWLIPPDNDIPVFAV